MDRTAVILRSIQGMLIAATTLLGTDKADDVIGEDWTWIASFIVAIGLAGVSEMVAGFAAKQVMAFRESLRGRRADSKEATKATSLPWWWGFFDG